MNKHLSRPTRTVAAAVATFALVVVPAALISPSTLAVVAGPWYR
jgi:hypothetical protein